MFLHIPTDVATVACDSTFGVSFNTIVRICEYRDDITQRPTNYFPGLPVGKYDCTCCCYTGDMTPNCRTQGEILHENGDPIMAI